MTAESWSSKSYTVEATINRSLGWDMMRSADRKSRVGHPEDFPEQELACAGRGIYTRRAASASEIPISCRRPALTPLSAASPRTASPGPHLPHRCRLPRALVLGARHDSPGAGTLRAAHPGAPVSFQNYGTPPGAV